MIEVQDFKAVGVCGHDFWSEIVAETPETLLARQLVYVPKGYQITGAKQCVLCGDMVFQIQRK